MTITAATAAVTIATTLAGGLHAFSLIETHIRACEAFRLESTPVHPGVLVPTERSILLQMNYLQEVRLALSTADRTVGEQVSVKVATLAEDLRIGNMRRPWVSSFDEVEELLSIMAPAA